MHNGHIPLNGLTSGTRVRVPVVDLAFSIALNLSPLINYHVMSYHINVIETENTVILFVDFERK